MSVYQAKGFSSRLAYLNHLAEEYAISVHEVTQIADLYGPSEDFDGLIGALDYYAERMERDAIEDL